LSSVIGYFGLDNRGNALEKAKKRLLAFLIMGITPERLGLCIALGIAFGLVPALGTATLLCTMAAFLFRLNLAAILLVNYFVYPLQLALLIPFIRAGEWLFGAKPLGLSLEIIRQMLETDPWKTVINLSTATIHAVTVWLLIAPVVVALVYLTVTPFLRKLRIERITAES
jgi:uncharacterized protein (DUF2062 family)